MQLFKCSLVTGLTLVACAASVGAQVSTQPIWIANGSQATEMAFEREMLALELAKTAAENGSQELSVDAFKRFAENYANKFSATPTTPTQRGLQSGFQSSLLGTPADPFGGQVVSGRVTQSFLYPHSLLPKVFDLMQTWRTEKFDASQVTKALQEAVLPSKNPRSVSIYCASLAGIAQSGVVPRTVTTTTVGPNGARVINTTTVMMPSPIGSVPQQNGLSVLSSAQRFRSPNINQALGFHLIDWAVQADQLEPLLIELEKRAINPEGQDAHAMIVYGRRSLGRADLAGEHIAKLLDQNTLENSKWELVIQAAMQPIAKDLTGGTPATDLSVASQPIAPLLLDRLLQNGLRANLIAIAPYYQHLIRGAIQAEDVTRLNELVPPFIRHLETLSSASTGSKVIENNVWNEVINECYRAKRPYMALKALRYVQEKSTAQSSAMPTRDEARLNALVGLSELPIEKRLVIAQALVLDETITSPDVFQFCSFPETAAPIYFRAASWQTAAKLLQADPTSGTISLLDVLLGDAETSGKLDETIDKLFERLPEDSLTHAAVVRLLCEWIRMRSEVREQPVPERIAIESQKLSQNEEFEQWFTKSAEPVRRSLASHYRRKPDSAAANYVNRNEFLERLQYQQATDDKSQWSSTASLTHWLNITVPEPPNSQAFAGYSYPTAPWHISKEGQLRAPFSSAALMLKYPLRGNYSLRCKITNSGDDWNGNSFGGVINGTFLEYRGRSQTGSRVTMQALNGRLTSSLNSSVRLNDNPTKTATVDIECIYEDKRVALSINGKPLAHAEFTSSSFPFVGLIPMTLPCEQGSIELTGSPAIAKQVNLLDSSFSGWSARRYDRLLTNVVQLRPIDQPPTFDNLSPSQLASWKVEGDELHSDGTFAASNTEDPQVIVRKTHNCMLYARPLLNGERFDYEVWQDNTTPAAAPVIGLTAMMIEEGKIRLHWLPTARELQLCGITANNRADDPQAEQLGDAKLNDSQWNKVSVRIEGNRVILSINGSDVYRRPIPEKNTTEFGWLSFPDQPSIRIRNATLTGNWPDKLPENLWEMK